MSTWHNKIVKLYFNLNDFASLHNGNNLIKNLFYQDVVYNSSINVCYQTLTTYLIYFSGGNVIQQFASTIQKWMRELGCANVPEVSQILQQFNKLGNEKLSETDNIENSTLKVTPRLYSERHEPHSTATVSGISADNLSLSKAVNALCVGLLENLREMFPLEQLLGQYGTKVIVGTGGALLRNNLLTEHVSSVFQVSLRTVENTDAATGAALFVMEC